MTKKWIPTLSEPGVNDPVVIWIKRKADTEFEDQPRIAAYYRRQGSTGAYFELAEPWRNQYSEEDALVTEDDEVSFLQVDEDFPFKPDTRSLRLLVHEGAVDILCRRMGCHDQAEVEQALAVELLQKLSSYDAGKGTP